MKTKHAPALPFLPGEEASPAAAGGTYGTDAGISIEESLVVLRGGVHGRAARRLPRAFLPGHGFMGAEAVVFGGSVENLVLTNLIKYLNIKKI